MVRKREVGKSTYWDELVVGGHVKGLCIHNGYLYAGVSENAVSRERRFTADGKVAKINLRHWRLEDMFNLRLGDETVGNINDIFYVTDAELGVDYVPRKVIDKRSTVDSDTVDHAKS